MRGLRSKTSLVHSVALGEMTHAKDLLTLLLSSVPTQTSSNDPSTQTSGSSTLTATVVTKPEAISSVRAFNAQLVISGKDEALRKASDLFRAAADNIERGLVKGERYWADALKIRRGNWGLVPAPLPFESSTGKGADKTSKDFLISFGLEECQHSFYKLLTYSDIICSTCDSSAARSWTYVRPRKFSRGT
jgi:mediator of RNA polymerase II transcription subunit 17, fungi type